MKSHLGVILLSFCLTSCASMPGFNPSLVRPWSKELSREEPHSSPYSATYKTGSYKLIYLAAHHDVQISSPTLLLVKKLFDTEQFNVVLLETFSNSFGKSPQFFVNYSKQGHKGDFIEGGESSYAVLLSSERNIPFFGAEPTHKQIFDGLLSKGYNIKDIVGFYLVRQTPQWVRQRRLKNKAIDSLARPYLKTVCKDFNILPEKCPSFEQLETWYKDKNRKQFSISINPEEVAPYSNGNYFTQRISSDVGVIRDYFIVEIIEHFLKEYKSVLVVYGASHLMTQEKVFREALGKPILSR